MSILSSLMHIQLHIYASLHEVHISAPLIKFIVILFHVRSVKFKYRKGIAPSLKNIGDTIQ